MAIFPKFKIAAVGRFGISMASFKTTRVDYLISNQIKLFYSAPKSWPESWPT